MILRYKFQPFLIPIVFTCRHNHNAHYKHYRFWTLQFFNLGSVDAVSGDRTNRGIMADGDEAVVNEHAAFGGGQSEDERDPPGTRGSQLEGRR